MKSWSSMTTKERDALVAERVLNWRNVKIKRDGVWGNPPWQKRWMWNTWRVASYSSDVRAAWIVMYSVQSEWAWSMNMYNVAEQIEVTIGKGHAYSTEITEAICLAALRNVGVGV